ncbi:unnamed protein product [Oikopleura dioica]|uniref:Uncharacterized protein n=1 Tax=Oikopleura dioica TaxID=34765 RepID=E4XZ48_OIKDI|nr:unnamed protein product [Oikopleura dioica]
MASSSTYCKKKGFKINWRRSLLTLHLQPSKWRLLQSRQPRLGMILG